MTFVANLYIKDYLHNTTALFYNMQILFEESRLMLDILEFIEINTIYFMKR